MFPLHSRAASGWWARCLCALALSTAPAIAYHVVVIDAGHGGADRGAHWYGYSEKTLTLDLAKRLETILRNNGVTTVMTRRTDKTVSLDDRAKLANRYSRSLLVSVHFNASRITGISGYETFYRSEKGKKVAQNIQNALVKAIPGKNRGITNNNFAVLTRTRGTAVLIEGGFLSNKAEAGRCGSAAHRQKLAQAIARGVLKSM
jgi:N-acetylmuramoyl-L-alanine amidase